MKLSLKGLALSFGIIWGVCLFLMTLLAVYFNGYGSEFLMAMPESVYPWYTISLKGSFIGLVMGFVDGAVCGLVFGWLYNLFAKK
ncbi:MAG: bacteriophage holin [Patescibacteria group bacterium]|nr:bacteriophage holin [Patescibacteria group bacterium]